MSPLLPLLLLAAAPPAGAPPPAPEVRAVDAAGPAELLQRGLAGDGNALERLVAGGGELARWAALARARQLVPVDPAAALEMLAGRSWPGRAALEARLLRAEALLGLHRSLEAREDLRALLHTEVEAEARALLARGGEDRGELDAARATWRALWWRTPTSPLADEAARRLAALGEPVDDLAHPPTREAALRRARRLVELHRAADALPIYEALGGAGAGPDDPAWILEVAMARFAARDYPGAVRDLGRLGPDRPGVPGGANTAFHHALALSRTGDYTGAAVSYRALVRNFPGAPEADTASFKLGYLPYDAGRLPEAIEAFRQHLAARPDSRHAAEARWFLAWSELRLGRLTSAREDLQALLDRAPAGTLAPAARYWLARLAGMEGDAEAERAGLEEVLARHPDSAYAWWARRRLGRPPPRVAEPVPAPLRPSDRPLVGAARALAAAGAAGWARDLLRTVRAHPGGPRALGLAWAAMDLGDPLLARRLAGPACRASPPPPVCRPAPLRELVGSRLPPSGLDPRLAWALMEVESGFRPDVVSPAGAVGLMQLMPRVAASLARPGERPPAPHELADPAVNVDYGTRELLRIAGTLRDHGIEPEPPVVAAAYNGGIEAVLRWWRAERTGPAGLDAWAEDIGYTETRRYVRRVLAALVRYQEVWPPGP